MIFSIHLKKNSESGLVFLSVNINEICHMAYYILRFLKIYTVKEIVK